MFYSLETPLHPLPQHSQVKAANLSHFPLLVERLGGDYRELLTRHGIDPQQAADSNHFLDCRPFVTLLEDCAARLDNPLFGLQLADLQASETYGMVAALCRASPDIRTALAGLIDYLPVVHSTESLLELAEGRHIAELRWSERSDLGENVQAGCQGLLLNIKTLRMLAGEGFVPSYINLPRDGFRGIASHLRKAVGCEVRLSREKACIAFPARLLEQRLGSASQPLFQLLDGYLSRLKARCQPPLLTQVEDYIRQALKRGEATLERCAATLEMPGRTLQLRLQAEGETFSGLLARQRLELAQRALRQRELSIAELADALGYAERTSFGRAFQRWTGMTPQQFRQRGQ